MLGKKIYNDLNGKNILVVGASTGIGNNLVSFLQKLGANSFIASSNIEKTRSSFNNIDSKNIFHVDFNESKTIETLADDIPPISGIAVVSGITKVIPPHLMTMKSLDNQIKFNLTTPLFMISCLLKRKKIVSPGSIVFTSASARINQASCTAAYAGAKLGLYGAAKSLSTDLSAKKIRVNCVSFDYVETEMIKNINITGTDQIIGVSPPEYTALPYLYLLSEKSRWMTGQIIAADAGRMFGKTRYV
jgi:3-oxoacyl-[acyl-carrier protein] reductase